MKDYDEIRKRYLAGESQRHIAKTLGRKWKSSPLYERNRSLHF